jgi:CRISPR-associated endonuclease/helicase Cas3
VLKAPDVADERLDRHRLLRVFGEESDSRVALVGATPSTFTGFVRSVIDLPSSGDIRRQIISLVPRRERPDFGTERQTLAFHVDLVAKQSREITERLALSSEKIGKAVELAAAWHDHGKDREIWQRAVGRRPDEGAMGKSGGPMRRVAGDYRHEFGSLREFIDSYEGKIDGDVFDLTMHLIAAHHGRARPHFSRGGFDPSPLARARSPQIAAEVVRRFGKLQRKYGHWRLAWLENLLRCADAMASAGKESG